MPYKDSQKQIEHRKLYYQQNKIKIGIRNKKWRELNLGKDKESKKVYYLKHKQEAIDTAKRWKKRNPEKVKEGGRVYREKNKEKIIKYDKEYQKRTNSISKKKYAEKNREKILIKHKEYRDSHRKETNQYHLLRRKNDPLFKLTSQLRHRVYMALRGDFKSGSAVKDLGCSISELKTYIENQFQEGMTWNNWTYKGWHLDHKIPLDFFDLTVPEEFIRACHYSNLQPMWWLENIRKSNKLNYGE